MPVILLKLLPYLLVLALVGYAMSVVYDVGKSVERSEWQEQAIADKKAAQEALDSVRADLELKAHKRQTDLARIINEKSLKIESIQHDAAVAAKRGLFISAKACPDNSNAVPRAADHTIKPATRSTSIRLPEEIEGRLTTTAALGNETTRLYLQCKELLKTANVQIVD